jgi:DNA-binding IclR family transcriptional regulator
VLGAFSADHAKRSLTEISSELDLAMSTVRRILVILEQRGLLEVDRTSGLYMVSPAVQRLVDAARVAKLLDPARPVFEELRRTTGETSILSVADGSQSVHVMVVPGTHFVSAFNPVGSRLALYEGFSIGQVLLAWRARIDVERVVPGARWKRRTPRGFGTLNELERELARVRRRGYAVNDRRTENDAWSVAAPVRLSSGLVAAAACLVMPSQRHTSALERRLAGAVVASADEIGRHWSASLPAGN